MKKNNFRWLLSFIHIEGEHLLTSLLYFPAISEWSWIIVVLKNTLLALYVEIWLFLFRSYRQVWLRNYEQPDALPNQMFVSVCSRRDVESFIVWFIVFVDLETKQKWLRKSYFQYELMLIFMKHGLQQRHILNNLRMPDGRLLFIVSVNFSEISEWSYIIIEGIQGIPKV